MPEIFEKLIANCLVISKKFHSFHTDMSGQGFIYYHPRLGGVYEYFQNLIDPLRERAGVLGITVTPSLDKLIEISDIVVLEEPIIDIQQIKSTVSSDLGLFLKYAKKCIDKFGKENDLGSQQLLIDIDLAVSNYKLRNDREQGF